MPREPQLLARHAVRHLLMLLLLLLLLLLLPAAGEHQHCAGPHLKMRRTTFVSASLNPMSLVSCSDMLANSSPPRNSSVKISTYTGFRLKGASCAPALGGPPGAAPTPPAAAAAAAPAAPGSGDGLVLADGVLLVEPAAPCGAGPELLLVAEGFDPRPGPCDTAAASAAAGQG